MPNSPVQHYSEQIIADQIEELMVDVAKIKNRSIALNIVLGVLATLSGLLRANNLQGLRNLAKVCNRELNTMRSEESTSEFLAQMDGRERELSAIADRAIKKYPLL